MNRVAPFQRTVQVGIVVGVLLGPPATPLFPVPGAPAIVAGVAQNSDFASGV